MIMAYNKSITLFNKYYPRWIIKKQVGVDGKDGRVFLLEDIGDNTKMVVVKLFKDTKSVKKVKDELLIYSICSKNGIAPFLYNHNEIYEDCKCIITDYLEYTLDEFIKIKNINLDMLKQIIKLYDNLGKLNIFHNDSNIGKNIMVSCILYSKFYLIDFGMSITFNEKIIKNYGKNPNYLHLVKIMNYITDNNIKIYLRNIIDKYEIENNVIIDFSNKMKTDYEKRLNYRLSKLKKI
jgi:hypothetical protein